MTSAPPLRKPRVFDADDPALSLSKQPQLQAANKAALQNVRAQSNNSENIHIPAKLPAVSILDRGIKWGMILISSMFVLLLLAAGVWVAGFTALALNRDDWVGWTAQSLLIVALVASTVVVLREVLGFLRIARLHRIRKDAEIVLAAGDCKKEKRVIKTLKALAKGRTTGKWGLAAFREEERYTKGPGKLIGLADRVLLAEADKEARRVIFESARRVGVVTAMVPIALLVTLFALTENVRMVRRLADAYGGRPGMLGGIRLLWRIIMHVAATGAVALTDDLFGQFLGQDIMRRISRRLGEGAFVGALTVRLGVAAIDTCRPLPFVESDPIRSRHIIRELFPELKLLKPVEEPLKSTPYTKTGYDKS
ncbi:MAG: TIGR01620 family protein [Hyphomicrobiaceae bacterium]|nr:TIGR01620 family protein [Hyphomicrobiaceae bacterium]